MELYLINQISPKKGREKPRKVKINVGKGKGNKALIQATASKEAMLNNKRPSYVLCDSIYMKFSKR